jgi:hypothetical protein
LKFSNDPKTTFRFMNAPRPFAATLLLASLTLAACRKEEVAHYRVPKEAEPARPPMAAAGGMASTPVATAEGELAWTAPAHWTTGPAAPMRKATLLIPGEGSGPGGELSITAFPGDVGGELANLNRWRSQAPLNLPPIAAADLEKSLTREEHNGLKFAVMDITGSGGRLLGAWAPYAGGTWFFKLTGPAAVLEKEKAAFQAFIASVKPAAPRTP